MEKPRPNYGISRIDQPEKKNHGWYVRVTHRGSTKQKYFADKSCGGKTKSLAMAREHRDGLVARLPKYKQEAASRPKRRVRKSGVTGVTHVVSRGGDGNVKYEYWQAAWNALDGRRRTAKYSIARYGNERALDLAVKARRKALREVNAANAATSRKQAVPA